MHHHYNTYSVCILLQMASASVGSLSALSVVGNVRLRGVAVLCSRVFRVIMRVVEYKDRTSIITNARTVEHAVTLSCNCIGCRRILVIVAVMTKPVRSLPYGCISLTMTNVDCSAVRFMLLNSL